ncbi:hypothetical protein TVAG_196210 [Trichomonas vaginalis G3]|uniref:Uncharacterized protein n=1 Tax=Trichomonas vaginalis (strain ATCC PRA-98 / G3) TaxID=412133 RepID=A2F4V3_TRIV3|nr:hypothetical protein TVAGG3_0088520 [Trichomonas vaginalis G3]EAY00061.1 hypothetical protein TVAG_196210 [Trichomonas vaginalis G3]KAI5543745.1 hypothetical protein TVAGG3_0088520 [Trichomonas vaginalis G3]|eukprot:XP_001312990.1 hypothetical protein [Trichomonas vaginalis G3]
MDKNTLRANKQRAQIQDQLRAALRGTVGVDEPVQHPFITAYQTLERELEFIAPFQSSNMFASVKDVYDASIALKEKAANWFYDDKVTPEGEQNLALLQFHGNILKIHRVLLSRTVEGTSLIQPAPATLQKQVEKTYEALNQLNAVMTQVSQIPKAPATRTIKQKSARPIVARKVEEQEDPLDLPLRISPFITEGSKKSTVVMDGVTWPRYV